MELSLRFGHQLCDRSRVFSILPVTCQFSLSVQLKFICLTLVLFADEANAFIKANEQRGKTLETTYEHVREQDLNDIEGLVRRRKELESRIQLNI